jgi:hypothetical protein
MALDWWNSIYQPHAEAWGLLFAFFKICLAAGVLALFILDFQASLNEESLNKLVRTEVSFSKSSTSLIDGLANERGFSVPYVAGNRSGDERFYTQMLLARDVVDIELNDTIPELEVLAHYEDELLVVEALKEWRLTLTSFRERIDYDTNLTQEEIFEYYSVINEVVIDGTHISTQTHASVLSAADSWVFGLEGKNLLGLESTIGTGAILDDKHWHGDAQIAYTRYIGEENAFFDSFFFRATHDTLEEYYAFLDDEFDQKVLADRDALQILEEPVELGMDSYSFWEEMDLLIQNTTVFIDSAYEDLQDALSNEYDDIHSEVLRNSFGLAIGIIACIYIILEAFYSYYSLRERQKKIKKMETQFDDKNQKDWN